jgi:hypothetical protein
MGHRVRGRRYAARWAATFLSVTRPTPSLGTALTAVLLAGPAGSARANGGTEASAGGASPLIFF